MRFPMVVLLILLCFSATLSQPKPIVADRGIASVDFKAKNWIEPGKVLKAFDASDGRLLFTQRLAYDEIQHNNSHISLDGVLVLDDTTIRPHPEQKIFLTSSNRFVKILDSRTGELLQTVVEPPVHIDLMGKPKITSGNMVLSADWSSDGRALYVLSANRHTVSLWQLVN